MAILASDKIDFKLKVVTRDRRMLYIDKRINLLRKYSNYKHIHPKYKNQILTELKREIDNSTITVGVGLNISL